MGNRSIEGGARLHMVIGGLSSPFVYFEMAAALLISSGTAGAFCGLSG